MARTLIPIPENILYSKIIFSIAKGNNYAQKISEDIEKDTGNLAKQLSLLKKEGFLYSKQEIDKSKFPMSKIRYYSINWDKINSEFFKTIASTPNTKEGKETFHMTYLRADKRWDDVLRKNFSIQIKNKGFKNRHLNAIFKKTFAVLSESKKDITLKEIFNAVPKAFMEGLYDTKQKKDIKEIKEFIQEDREFQQLVSLLFHHTSLMESYLYDSIWEGINNMFDLIDNPKDKLKGKA